MTLRVIALRECSTTGAMTPSPSDVIPDNIEGHTRSVKGQSGWERSGREYECGECEGNHQITSPTFESDDLALPV